MKKPALFFACLIGLVNPLIAQDSAIPSIKSIQEKYETGVAETAKPISEFQDRYVTELAKLREDAQNAGKLDLILEIRDEVRNFKDGTQKPTTDPGLLRLRKIYSDQIAILEKARQTEVAVLRADSQKQLLEIQTAYTKAGDIEAAIAVKKEIIRLQSEVATTVIVKQEMPATSLTPEVEAVSDEKKEKRKSNEKLRDWLVGTDWKEANGNKISFLEGGKSLLTQSNGQSVDGKFDTDEENAHVNIEWESGSPVLLEASKGGGRLSHGTQSTTWVRLDHHLAAVKKFNSGGPIDSKKELERRLEGTTWSRNHRAGRPFLYVFNDKDEVFLSILNGGWSRPSPFEVKDERHITVGDFELEFSEDYSTWRTENGDLVGILVSAE